MSNLLARAETLNLIWGTHKARSTTQSSAPWTIFYRAGWLRTMSPWPSQVHPGQEATFERESFAFHPSLSWTFQLVRFQISPSPGKALSFPGDVSESREVQSPGDPLASESASHSAKPFSQALLAPPKHVTFSLGVHCEVPACSRHCPWWPGELG